MPFPGLSPQRESNISCLYCRNLLFLFVCWTAEMERERLKLEVFQIRTTEMITHLASHPRSVANAAGSVTLGEKNEKDKTG